MRKGQAATEFLMTYGWAILIVLISIGALAYFGVLNPSRFLPSSCLLFAGLACTDFSVGDNSMTLILQNGFGKDITIQSFNVVNDAGGAACQWGVQNINLKMGDGQQKSISLGQCTNGIIGTKFRGTIYITYLTLDGITHTRTGSLTSQVENLCTSTFDGIDTYTAGPCFSHEEDYNPFWGASLLASNDGLPITGDDEGIYNPDYIAMGFPNIGIPDATPASAMFTFTHKENKLDPVDPTCVLTTGSPASRHEVRCYDGSAWNYIGTYTIHRDPTDTPPMYITESFPVSCVSNGASANKILIKVTFDPLINACGTIDIDSAKVDVTI